jgi:hypothetical protein
MILFLLLGWVLGGFTVAAAASSQGFRQTLKARSLHGWELRTSHDVHESFDWTLADAI